MKRRITFLMALFLSAGMAFAQTGGDKSTLNPQPLPPGRHPQTEQTKTETKAHKGGKKSHKGGKKSKKGSSTTTTTPPPK